MDPFDNLVTPLKTREERCDGVLLTLRSAAFNALHKAGPVPGAKPPEKDDNCPHCGKGMEGHAEPDGDEVNAGADNAIMPEQAPEEGAEQAEEPTAAGGAPDPIEDLVDEDGDGEAEGQAEGSPGDAPNAAAGEVPPEEGDGIEDIVDDGDNHGVGDLNEDGNTQSLAQELAALEKDYYAARGLHGNGSGKAEVQLDKYHRVVRKLVRAVTGSAAPGQPGEQVEDAGPQEVAPGEQAPEAPPEAAPERGAVEGQAKPGEDVNEAAGQDAVATGAQPAPEAAAAPEEDDEDDENKPFGKSARPLDPFQKIAARKEAIRKSFQPPAAGAGERIVLRKSGEEVLRERHDIATGNLYQHFGSLRNRQGSLG